MEFNFFPQGRSHVVSWWLIIVQMWQVGSMDARQHQLLLNELRAFRKQNQTLKEEWRHLNATIKEREDVIKQYRKTVSSLKNEIVVLQEENEVLQDAMEENSRLKEENENLRRLQQNRNGFVTSTKSYLELPYYARCRLKKKLFSHFAECLEVSQISAFLLISERPSAKLNCWYVIDDFISTLSLLPY